MAIKHRPTSKKDAKLDVAHLEVDGVIHEIDSFNQYYSNVHFIFRIVEIALVVTLLIFIVFSMFNNAGVVTYDSLEYVVRNFAMRFEENEGISDVAVRYNPDSKHTFSLFATGFRNIFAPRENFSSVLCAVYGSSSLFGKKYHIKKGKFGTF